MIKFETKIKQVGEYLGCNQKELWSEISEICLDKQKVRDAIDKFYYSINKTDTTFENKISDLKQELGLK